MPTNSDNSQGESKQEPTSVFEVPEELIAKTKKADSLIPPTKKDLGKRRYFLVFTNLEGIPSFEVINKATVGRTTGDITVADPNLSNEHATFTVQEGLMSVTDHGSTNGTFIDGKRIKPGKNMIIDQGDHILLGSVSVEIKLELPEKFSQTHDNVTLIAEEQSEEKKPSFFARLKEKFKSKKSKKNEKKFEVKNLLPIFTDTVGAATRLWALVGDLCLTLGLSIIIGSNEYFEMICNDLYNALIELVTPYLPPDPMVKTIETNFKIIFPMFILFYSLKLIASFIFGVSIAQMLMGLKGGKSALWNRAGGFLRTVLEIVTAPLLIFDLPALFSRRTIKEVLTFTNISAGNRLLRFVGTLIFVPCLIIFAFVSPVLKNLDYVDQGVLVEEKMAPRKKKKKKEVTEVKEGEVAKVPKVYKFESPLFLYTGEVTLSDDYVLIPDFDLANVSKKRFLIPVLRIYDLDKKTTGEFSVFKRYSVVDLVHVAEAGNPLFPFNFKELSRWYGNRNSPTLKKANTNVKGEFSINEASEMEALLRKSLELNLVDVHEHMLEYGPFIKGFTDLREVLKTINDTPSLRSVTLQKINKMNLLIFPNEDEQTELIMPINFTNGVIYKFAWRGSKAKTTADNFYKEFFAKIEGRIYTGELDFPKNEAGTPQVSLNPLNITDLFFSKKLNKEEREIFMQYVFNYFYSISETAVKAADENLQKIILRTVQKLINYLKYIPDLDQLEKEKVEKSLSSLEAALKNNDASFFGQSQ